MKNAVEYKIVPIWNDPAESVLNPLGEHGWILCHMEGMSRGTPEGKREHGWMMVFYRGKQEQVDGS